MGNPYVGNATTFLVSTLFGIYILLVMLRFLFQIVRADFYNPFSQFIVKATNPPLRRMRRIIPAISGVDSASVCLMLALKYVELWLVQQIMGQPDNFAGLAVLSAAEIMSLAVKVFMFAIFIQVVISWIAPGTYNPITSLLHTLTEPLLAPARRIIPPAGGLDLSPMVVIIGLVLVSMLIVAPITDIGRGLLM